jgi:malonate-semialdehyde dehydrogenase (acetylating) / methylmalonate-semialdehyde dehydrogenase
MTGALRLASNYVGGRRRSPSGDLMPGVWDPATGHPIAEVRASTPAEVDEAAEAAAQAGPGWRRCPASERVQWLFRLKRALEDRLEDFARSITLENGKVLTEARGEVRRAIDNMDMACGSPVLLQGRCAEDVSAGIDELLLRQPVGVCAAIVPFNFPLMIPCWFLPYALACGNTFVLKASERTPLTAVLLFEVLHELGLPPGVVNLVQGGAGTAEVLIDHPSVSAVSFVGSTAGARAVYARAAASGKRVQAQGGAKNSLVILPDAPIDAVAAVAAESAFGNAGQRCLAGGAAITVGGASDPFAEAVSELARNRHLGSGLVDGIELGPVITGASRARIKEAITVGARQGGRLLADGRDATVPGNEQGFFVGATVIDDVGPDSDLARTEVFGPVLGITRVDDLDGALRLINSGHYGNMACIFTESGAAARQFRYEAQAGNIGVNVGVAQPMPSFPFSGWKDSFFGDLHAHGAHAIEFFTQTKVVVERWGKTTAPGGISPRPANS